MDINRAKLNLVLSTLAFAISAAGSVLLHIVFATSIYKSTGSGLLTSVFISLLWMPALVVLIFKSDWEDGVDPRKRWLKLELIAAALTCLLLLFIDRPNYFMLFLTLFLRGIVDHIARIIKTVSARYIFPEDKVTQYAPVLQAGYHVGIGLAAVIGIGLDRHFTQKTAITLDILSYLIAAVLLYFVKTTNHVSQVKKERPLSLKARLSRYRLLLFSDQRLFFSALTPPLVSIFFQATYGVFQPLFPLKVLRLDANAVAISYVLASFAILGGSSFFAYINQRFDFYKANFARTRKIVFGLSCIGAISYLCAAISSHYLISAVFFTLMVFTFIIIWMIGYTGMVAYAPEGELGSVVTITFAFGYCAGSLCTLATGALIDYFNGNFPLVVAILMGAYLCILGGGHLMYLRLDVSNARESLVK